MLLGRISFQLPDPAPANLLGRRTGRCPSPRHL